LTPGGFLIELTSDGPKRRFPPRYVILFDLDTWHRLRCRGHPCNLRLHGLNTSRFLTISLLLLRLELGRRSARRFLALDL
jgi:hypothetical protein